MIVDTTHASAEQRTTERTPPRSRRWSWPRMPEWSERSPSDRDRLFGRYAALCAIATMVMLATGLVVGPARDRPGLLLIEGLAGPAIVISIWFLERGFTRRLLLTAGLVLMALGVISGATLTDGLDGAAVMPLAGALLLIPVLRGRRLLAMFVLAFVLSMVGETAAYVVGGMTQLADLVSTPVSLAESAVMLAFTYGLVWWVSNEWGVISARSEQAVASHRQVLAFNERLLATLDPPKVLNLIADSLQVRGGLRQPHDLSRRSRRGPAAPRSCARSIRRSHPRNHFPAQPWHHRLGRDARAAAVRERRPPRP